MNSGNVSVGFGMALAMNVPVMKAYADMDEKQKQSILNRTHQVRSKGEMQELVTSIAANHTL